MLVQMSGMDAGFLYMETPTLHMHTLKVAIIDPGSLPHGIPFPLFRRVLARKLEGLPAFRQRVVEIPFGLGRPVWVDDPDFELDRHLQHLHLSSPGTQSQLDAQVSQIAGRALPRDRPLWEITMIDGLARGRVAFVCKIHHSMADGTAALEMLLQVLRDSPGSRPEPGAPVLRQPLPSRVEMLKIAAAGLLQRIVALPALLGRTIRGLFRLWTTAVDRSNSRVPRPFDTPVTRWNAALTSERSFVTITLPLAKLRQVKRALGVTFNDVVLGVCAGALRAHLLANSELPERPLLASVPVNTHPEEKGRVRGNHVGNLITSLRTDIEDPVTRLRAIHDVTESAKKRYLALGPDILERWFEYTPRRPFSAIVRLWSDRHIADWIRPPVNLVISTVPGPSEVLEIAGARLEAIYSVGPILEGVGLNFTGWSYGDTLNLVALGCPQQIPDLASVAARLPEALNELVQACELRLTPLADESRDDFATSKVAKIAGAGSTHATIE